MYPRMYKCSIENKKDGSQSITIENKLSNLILLRFPHKTNERVTQLTTFKMYVFCIIYYSDLSKEF